MKSSKLIYGLSIFSIICFTCGNVYAVRIINWQRDNGGRHGYKTVNQTYNGTTNPGHDQLYTVSCKDPGSEGCRFVGISAPNDVDDYSVNVASAFFDEMNDAIDFDALTKTSGSWDKTIVSQYGGRDLKIYVSSVWNKDSNGIMRITTTITPVYI